MNRKHIAPLFISLLLAAVPSAAFAQKVSVKKAFRFVEKQAEVMLTEIPKAHVPGKPQLTEPRTLENGELKLVTSRDWTSGFFPGELWYLYQYSGDSKWLNAAKKYTDLLQQEQWNGGTHDMGFKMYCSYGNGYRLTKDTAYRRILIQSARTLITRFNAKAGVIRSWDHGKDKWSYPVIIDNMMNLELLFAATRFTGDSSFYRIAVTHANTTLKNHFRTDYSSWHVVDYDTATGSAIKKTTHQGFADESAWARGQAWGLYAYTMCFRETGDSAYLHQAQHIGAFVLHHLSLPADKIPYWDFNAPGIPNEPRDASAAAVIASGLLELSTYSAQHAKAYRKAATAILQSLGTKYCAAPGGSKGFILLHSTGHKPGNSEIDVPLNYADYYYLEALLRYQNLP